jgi:hypothetical protein
MTTPRRNPVGLDPGGELDRRTRRARIGMNCRGEGGPPCGPTGRAGAIGPTGPDRPAGRPRPAALPSMPSEGDALRATTAASRTAIR